MQRRTLLGTAPKVLDPLDDKGIPYTIHPPVRQPPVGPTASERPTDNRSPGKSRRHLDLRPRAGGRNAEVQRLLDLGARSSLIARDIHGPGVGWVTVTDPEGNQFCVLRSEAEHQAAN